MSEDSLVSVYKTRDVSHAEVIRAALEGEGIACEIENEHQGGFTGVTSVRLFVREKDKEAAEAFINLHEDSSSSSD